MERRNKGVGKTTRLQLSSSVPYVCLRDIEQSPAISTPKDEAERESSNSKTLRQNTSPLKEVKNKT